MRLILLVTTVLFISAVPWLGRRGHFGTRAVHYEARRKTAKLSLFSVRYLYFFAFTVVISIEQILPQRTRECAE